MPFERWLYAWRARLRALFDREGANRELHEELQHHVDRDIEARCANGVPPAEARRQALAALGGLARTSEHVRASRFGASLEDGLRDIRHGLRLLIRYPGFTAATVLLVGAGLLLQSVTRRSGSGNGGGWRSTASTMEKMAVGERPIEHLGIAGAGEVLRPCVPNRPLFAAGRRGRVWLPRRSPEVIRPGSRLYTSIYDILVNHS